MQPLLLDVDMVLILSTCLECRMKEQVVNAYYLLRNLKQFRQHGDGLSDIQDITLHKILLEMTLADLIKCTDGSGNEVDLRDLISGDAYEALDSDKFSEVQVCIQEDGVKNLRRVQALIKPIHLRLERLNLAS